VPDTGWSPDDDDGFDEAWARAEAKRDLENTGLEDLEDETPSDPPPFDPTEDGESDAPGDEEKPKD
jgi:hypothetical protein